MMFGKKPRIYHKDGKAYPSVTSVLSALEKNALIPWAANCAVDCIEKWMLLYPHRMMPDLMDIKARTAYKRESMEAREYGTYIHILCELYFTKNTKIESPHEQTDKLMKSFYKWCKKHNVKPIETEVVVFGDNYAGRVDLICEMDAFWEKPKNKKDQKNFVPRRVVVLIDLKTGKVSYYPTWYLQTAAYRNAHNSNICDHFQTRCEGVPYKDNPCSSNCSLAATHHGVLKFNKLTCRVNYKDFTPTYSRDLKAFKLIAEFYNLFVELK